MSASWPIVGQDPARRRPSQRPRRAAFWLQIGLLALAPLLVLGFYRVVDDAVERAAVRRLAPPPRMLQAGEVQPVTWECGALPGAGVHSACRPAPAGSDRRERSAGN